MANGLLDLLGGLGTTPPSYMEGLLGSQATQDLQKRSIGTGLANALVGYLAMPKNQGLGLGRILAGAAQAGMQGAQGVYDTATQDYMQAQKIAELQRAKEQQTAREAAIAQLPPEQQALYRAYGEAAVPKLVEAAMPKQRERKTATVGNVVIDTDTGLPIYTGEKEVKERKTQIAPNGQLIYTDTGEVVTNKSFAAPKEPKTPDKQTWKTEVGNDGKMYYVPQNPTIRSSIFDQQGNPTTSYAPKQGQEKQLTEGQGKAANFLNRMQFSTKTLNKPMIDTKTGKPILDEAGNPVTLEDYVGNPSAIAQTARSVPSWIPLVGSGAQTAANASISPNRQILETAQDSWVTANLRKESGAVIGADEMKQEREKYFPVVGDTPERVKFKKNLRLEAEKGMLIESGQANKLKGSGRSDTDILNQYGVGGS